MARRESIAERHAINAAAIEEFRANGGQVGGRYANMPLLLLTTIGAKSGQPRTLPLGYTMDCERYIVTASRGGGRYNPDWYHNLLANPLVTVEVGSKTFQAHASVASGDERERLFTERPIPGSRLAAHQSRTTRVIPIIVLERVE